MTEQADPLRQLLHFCVCCFASEENGSWGEVVGPGWCANCGAGSSTFAMPRWAIESIRKSASWVGKRFYPSDEDKEQSAEVKRMRAALPIPKARRTEPVDEFGEDGQLRAVPGRYWVKQPLPKHQEIAVTVSAKDPAEALEKTRTQLPWWPDK